MILLLQNTDKRGNMSMQSKVNEAAKRKNCGYNCAQAVACTYCDMAGIDEETAKNLTQGFAAGIGGSMEATCGAIIGAVSVLGMINKDAVKTNDAQQRLAGHTSRNEVGRGHYPCEQGKVGIMCGASGW